MKSKKTWLTILSSALLLIVIYFAINYYVEQQNSQTLADIDTAIARQELLLVKLADLTRQNGADEITEKIIMDCPADERRKFDSLLDKLSTKISTPELSDLDALFYKCGDFYATRKSVMASRLIREVEILSQYFSLRENFKTPESDQEFKLEAWNNLADAELKSSEYFSKLVSLQGDIIVNLRSGKTISSPDITANLAEVSSVRGQMLILTKQIEKNRIDALQS